MNFFTNLIFLIEHPTVVIVAGHGRTLAAEAVFQVLKNDFSVKKISEPGKWVWASGKQIIILELDIQKLFELKFLVRKSKQTILIFTAGCDIPADEYFFASDRAAFSRVPELLGMMLPQSRLLVNFDDETVRELKHKTACPVLTFGFQAGADFQASDVKITENGTNFKLNYKGNIVPVWLKELFGKEQIYSSLSAVCAAEILGMNLIEASQSLKFYRSLPGRMRMLRGNKDSRILDDSENSSLESMLEALAVLRDIKKSNQERDEGHGRAIAVLGDVLDIGKYAMAGHQTIGERAAKVCDMLLTVGPRAKFIARGAVNTGMASQKIFEFDEPSSAGEFLDKETKKGDIILVDGAKELDMGKVIEEIRRFVSS